MKNGPGEFLGINGECYNANWDDGLKAGYGEYL
jgi:hypothetical protein